MQTVQFILHGLGTILAGPDLEFVATAIEEAGGLERLKNLQTYPNKDIYKLSHSIIDYYFNPDDAVSERIIDEHTHANAHTHR